MNQEIRNVLVTGADGFIGRHLVRRLKEDGYSVFTFDVKDGDIADEELNFEQIDHVFHLAAMTFVPASWDNPKQFYRTNVLGTANILDFCNKRKCSITIPSTYMYGNPQYLPIDERHPIDMDVSPYHNSKYLSENIAEFYAKRFQVPCTILRLFNVFGCGQNDNFLIPHLIREVCSEKEQIVVKDLEPKRDYIFIDDVITAFVKTICRTESDFRVYNVGMGVSWSVEEVAADIMEVFGQKKTLVSLNERRNGEIMDTVADISKIQNELGWKPQYSLIEGLKKMKTSILEEE